MISISGAQSFSSDLDNLCARVQTAMQQAGGLLTRAVEEIYFEEIRTIFETERWGSWEDLAESTQRERKSLGYSPKHPILVRTGSLLASLTEADSLLVYETTGRYDSTAIWGTTDPRFAILNWGSNDFLIPPRNMLPEPTTLDKRVADVCTETVDRLLK